MPSKKARANSKKCKQKGGPRRSQAGQVASNERRGDTAYIHVGSYFPQFEEYIVMTPFDNIDEGIKKCKEDIAKSQIKSFEKDGKSYVGIIDGESMVKLSMESMKEAITKYTPWMINHLRENNDERYTNWNTDIALYVCYNSVINQKRIVLVDPSVVMTM